MIAIRQARLPEDVSLLQSYIDARRDAEAEPRLRQVPAYTGDRTAALFTTRDDGAIFVAEADGRPVGWALVIEALAPVQVIAEERRHACVCELFVEEGARRQGAGQSLMTACEDWARARNLGTIQIGHLSGNARAEHVYDKAGYAPYVVFRRKRLT
jgi:GNAT superfamily N-acetyltransferase